jgi:hypothetical protein
MRLSKTAHTSRPWRIHQIAPDFELEDVWALPTPGGPDDFPRLVSQVSHLARLIATDDTLDNPSRAARVLFELRSKIGKLLGWDEPNAGIGSGGRRCATDCQPICATHAPERSPMIPSSAPST